MIQWDPEHVQMKGQGDVVATKDERFETRSSRRPRPAQANGPPNVEPDEGLRLMKAFTKIRRRDHREILIRLATALAASEDED